MENRGRALQGGTATSPESAHAAVLFEQFVAAGTFKSVLSTYRQLCEVLRLKPTNISSFYPRLKVKLHSWKAASLWAKLDKRASHKCYNRGKACPNTRVLIIGAGPCGLRAAIEAQLLGAKVVVVEKRDRFSRNNVLHLWPFVIHDLRNLGAKKFFGKFCAGSIDHISIRQLQIILLKVALLLGVEVHENVGFLNLKEPPEDQAQERIGWRAFINPSDHPVSQYEFDVLIGADGKRNTLLGFNRKEFRGKLAIAVTANFINRRTLEEAGVEEISGVAFIFNQKFFQEMRELTGIDLENIVYYKDDTHYFVMTAKKQSLLDRGVIINDYNDTARLLSAENVDRAALMEYARDAAAFSTDYQLPSPDFAVNHYGQADVAMFDFTSMYAAENACRITELRGHKLLQGLVGDSLLEPFWPTGSGCARGFLSSLDVAWMIKSWSSGKMTNLQVLAEREAIYRLLAQMTPENLSKDLNQYTLNPSSRYPNLNLQSVLPSQVRSLYCSDRKLEEYINDLPAEIPKKKRKRESIVVHPDALLNWCQRQVALHDVRIENLTSSWKNGLALCSILHRYRPDLIDLDSLNPEDVAKNNQLAFDICEKELCIPPVMTGQEMADCEVPDKLSMVSYLAQIYETFRGEIPVVCQPKSSNDDRAISPYRPSGGTSRSILNRISNKFQNKRKYSIEKESAKDKSDSLKRGRHPQILHKRRSKEKDRGIAHGLISDEISLMNFKTLPTSDTPKESINSRVKNLEMKLRNDAGLRCHLMEKVTGLKSPLRSEHTELNIKQIQEQLQRNGSGQSDKPSALKVGRLRKDEWNVKMWEDRITQQEKLLQRSTSAEKSAIKQAIFDSKRRLIETKLQTGEPLTAEEKCKFAQFDSKLDKLKVQLSKGNLDAGERGHNQVAAMTEHMSKIWDKRVNLRRDPLPPAPVINNLSQTDSMSPVGGSEMCYFCTKRVYVMERSSAEGLFFHRSCFKCDYCNASLRRGHYSFDKDTVGGGKFYCSSHYRMQKPDNRTQEIMKRKQAFLSNAFDEQERERMYSTILANTEKALSPNKQALEAKEEETVPDSPVPAKLISPDISRQDVKSPVTTLLEPLNIIGRDQTPERVEYENSILDYSEEELLTSELEEEELRQKNFGPITEVEPNEEEFFDYSSDSESDEEAYAEELERSLTADETRKLAERWQRKYSGEHSLMDSEDSSSSDEASDTEIGSEDGTSDDINSDEEYNIGIDKDAANEKENGQEPIAKTLDVKEDFTVEVPVIDLKGLNQNLEDTSSSESDISEDTSASEGDLASDSSSEEDSESNQQEDVPPPNIPTIVIDESPPQDIDQDQDWSGMVTPSVAVEPIEMLEKNVVEEDSGPCIDTVAGAPVTERSSEIVACYENISSTSQNLPDIICDKNEIIQSAEFKNADDIIFPTVKELPPAAADDNAINNAERSLVDTQEQCLTIGQNSQPYAAASIDDLNVCETSANTVVPVYNADGDNKNIPCVKLQPLGYSTSIEQKLGKNNFSDINVVVGENNNSCLLGSEKNSVTEVEISAFALEDRSRINGSSLIDEAVAHTCSIPPSTAKARLLTPDVGLSSSDKAEEALLTPSQSNDLLSCEMSDSSMSICKEDDSTSASKSSPVDLTFVTVRKKHNRTNNDSFKWDSDNSVSLPWFCEDSEDLDFSFDHKPIPANQNSTSGVSNCIASQDILTDSHLKPSSTDTSLLSRSSLQDTSSEYFTAPEMPNLNSTPLHPSEKTRGIGSLLSNDLLSPISENESKSLINECVIKTKGSFDNAMRDANKPISDQPFTPLSNTESVYYSDVNSNIMLDDSAQARDSSANSSVGNNSGKAKYGGSFAEKIRPKSALGDTIYLRSLNINLQKQQFSSITRSSDKLNNVVEESNICKKLFHGSDKSLSQRKPSPEDASESYSKGFKRQTSVPLDSVDSNSSHQSLTSKLSSSVRKDQEKINQLSHEDKVKSVAVSTPPLHHESYRDPVSPYTYAQSSRSTPDPAFPTKMRPKCDMDLNKLREKREKRKSVHENIQGLPFADEEKASTPIEPPSSPGSVFLSTSNDALLTPKANERDDQHLVSSAGKGSAHEKARKEARARARLKSDEELGLSPKNYRKKYQRQLSMSSIYYDELNGDEFYDHENEDIEDELPDGILRAKKVQLAEAQSISSDIDNTSIKSAESVHSVICALEAFSTKPEENNLDNSVASITPTMSTTPTTSTTPTASVTPTVSQPPSSPITKTSSSKTSPEIFDSAMNLFEPKDSSTKKEVNASVESFPDEEKLKANNKKSFFSILNFGKGHILKDKSAKNKGKESERASSLPADLCNKAPAKQKPFTNLKLSKGKDKPKEKRRQKHFSTGTQDIIVIENTYVEPVATTTKEQIEGPKSSFLSQTKIIPKYEVYRNPGVRLTAIPNHIPTHKTENGLAPKASEDSFSDTEDDTQRSSAQRKSLDPEAKEKDASEKEVKAQRIMQKLQRQQELKRMRTAQEIQRRMEELEVQQKDLEQKGVELEKVLRAEGKGLQPGNESDLMQEWYKLCHSKNQLVREEQELLIRLKELELEDRHCHLQQEMTERLAQDVQKNPFQISEEKKILTEMLRIVEERDELVALLEQLRLKEEEAEKSFSLTTLETDKQMPHSSKS